MVGNGQDGNAVRLGGLALVLQGVDSVKELLLEKDEGALSMLESTLVAAELRQDSACVEVGVGGVVDLFEAALDLESFLEVLEGRMEFSLAAIVAGQVIECYSPTGGVPLREDLSLLQELQHRHHPCTFPLHRAEFSPLLRGSNGHEGNYGWPLSETNQCLRGRTIPPDIGVKC